MKSTRLIHYDARAIVGYFLCGDIHIFSHHNIYNSSTTPQLEPLSFALKDEGQWTHFDDPEYCSRQMKIKKK